jgi:hypothetical protein
MSDVGEERMKHKKLRVIKVPRISMRMTLILQILNLFLGQL